MYGNSITTKDGRKTHYVIVMDYDGLGYYETITKNEQNAIKRTKMYADDTNRRYSFHRMVVVGPVFTRKEDAREYCESSREK